MVKIITWTYMVIYTLNMIWLYINLIFLWLYFINGEILIGNDLFLNGFSWLKYWGYGIEFALKRSVDDRQFWEKFKKANPHPSKVHFFRHFPVGNARPKLIFIFKVKSYCIFFAKKINSYCSKKIKSPLFLFCFIFV